jgi:hypothetical protein
MIFRHTSIPSKCNAHDARASVFSEFFASINFSDLSFRCAQKCGEVFRLCTLALAHVECNCSTSTDFHKTVRYRIICVCVLQCSASYWRTDGHTVLFAKLPKIDFICRLTNYSLCCWSIPNQCNNKFVIRAYPIP